MTSRGAGRRLSDPIVWVLAAGFLAGLAHLFVLPLFEGFDETAHYSSVQLIADEGRIPAYGKDRFAKDVVDYLSDAPGPYLATPPIVDGGGLTYAEIFTSPEREATAREMIAGRPAKARAFAPAGPLNWEAQHPPLSYLLLAPVYQATKALDWKTHLFLLRLFCLIVATAGLAIGVYATKAHLAADRSLYGRYAPLIMAAWPFYAPMFTLEMARLGNDAFCLFFAGLAWAALLRFLEEPRGAARSRFNWALMLGLALGMGALVKAFFLPVAAGVVVFLAIRDVVAARAAGALGAKPLFTALAPAATAALVFIGVAGWWYGASLAGAGSLTGANDILRLKAEGDFGALLADRFSWDLFWRRMLQNYLSFLWAGTWSFATPPSITIIVLGVFAALVVGRYLVALFIDLPKNALAWAPLFIFAPLEAGIVYHALTQLAMGEAGVGTPGWYFHIFAAPFGLAYAIGATALWRRAAGRIFLGAALVYSLLFAMAAEFYLLGVYSGCVVKPGPEADFRPAACFGDLGEMARRLDVVANPAMAGAAILLAAGAAAVAVLLVVRHARASRP